MGAGPGYRDADEDVECSHSLIHACDLNETRLKPTPAGVLEGEEESGLEAPPPHPAD